MPLPDAERSKRVYTLLQNTDLENLSQSSLADVGDPISVEKLNEDELRRIVLVNLARLSVKGEWNGLLTAGGGGSDWVGPAESLVDATSGKLMRTDACQPIPSFTQGTKLYNSNYPTYYPFVAPESGTVDEIHIRVNATIASQSMLVGVFENTSDDGPGDQLGEYATISIASSTTPSAAPNETITLTRGTTYWLGYTQQNSGATDPTIQVCTDGSLPWNSAISQTGKNAMREATNSNTLPTTAPTSGYTLEYAWKMVCGFVMG